MKIYTAFFFLYVLLLFNNQINTVNTPQQNIARYEQSLKKSPNDGKIHQEFGSYLAELDKQDYYEKAYFHLKKAIDLSPFDIDLFFSFGLFCCGIGKFHESIKSFQSISHIYPDITPILYNIGFALKTAGKLEAATLIYRKIIALDPDYPLAHLSLALTLLSQGNFKEGWQEHQYNLKHLNKSANQLLNLIQENKLAGKTIYLQPEGGLGDSIQFIRYAQKLHSMGAHTIVSCPPALQPLFKKLSYIDTIVPTNTKVMPYDGSATLMTLPVLFCDDEQTMPTSIPYIFPPQSRIDYWKQELAHDQSFKIGICWQPDIGNDTSRLPIARRGIPLSYFDTLSSLSGITLYSLQKFDGTEQLQTAPSSLRITTFDNSFDVDHGSFIDSAAIMHSLDLIISTDTAIAHLAGAMGKRVWLLLPYSADWRWIINRTDSPWYPTMRIFKQPHPFDWQSVMHEVTTTLKKEIY